MLLSIHHLDKLNLFSMIIFNLNQGWQSESGIRRFFINYQESGISVQDSDSNFFVNINILILRYLFHVYNGCKMYR